jgi:hypothetical protein
MLVIVGAFELIVSDMTLYFCRKLPKPVVVILEPEYPGNPVPPYVRVVAKVEVNRPRTLRYSEFTFEALKYL